MLITKKILLLSLPLMLTSCSDEVPKEEKPNRKPSYGIYQEPMNSLEKAKGLEQQMMQDTQKRDEQMRQRGG